MSRYRIEIMKSSALTDIRIFDVEAPTRLQAVKSAAEVLFGLDAEDFSAKRLSWFNSTKWKASHKRMGAIWCNFKIVKV